MTKTKKEHYVPQSYLEKWCSNSGQVFVFDKENETSRINSITDVASENYFYDLKVEDILLESGISIDQLKAYDSIKINDPQYTENQLKTILQITLKGFISNYLTESFHVFVG